MKKIITLTLAFLLVFSAVFGNGNTADAASANKVKSITVRIGKKNVTKKTYSLKKGKSATLKISVSPKKSKKSVTFRSAKKSIVTVSKKGKVTARKKGTAKITITVTGKNRKKKSTWVKVRVTEQKNSTPSSAAPTPTVSSSEPIPAQTPEVSPSQPAPIQTPEVSPSESPSTYQPEESPSVPTQQPDTPPSETTSGGSENNGNEGLEEMKVKIKVGDQELIADLEDNATTRALMEKLPLTLPMMDLYGREMCYRFDEALPTEQLRSDGYEVGDLAYWPPRHSFVILYGQNGEQFSRQHLGHISSGVEIFDGIGDVTVTIEKN